jgi:hypothetical protein
MQSKMKRNGTDNAAAKSKAREPRRAPQAHSAFADDFDFGFQLDAARSPGALLDDLDEV